MRPLMKLLWQDQYGVILSTEIVVVGTVLVIGLITGMTCLQEAVNGELEDFAGAIGHLDQSYHFAGQTGRKCCPVSTAGSSFRDCEEDCDREAGDVVAVSCERANVPCRIECRDELPCETDGDCCVDPCHRTACDDCCHDPCASDCCHDPCHNCGHSVGNCGDPCGHALPHVSGCQSCGQGFAGSGVGGSRCLDTGVPHLKVTEWDGPVTGAVADDCESCPKRSFINIPDEVW